jgi:regulator of protease activity HflC (stomatin/prohibitin superfamily)
MIEQLSLYLPAVIILVIFLAAAIKILREYERAVVFTLGRFSGVRGPGLIILIPFVQQMVRVDLRMLVLDVPEQDVISHDNVSVKVNAVLYFRVIDPERATIQVENYMMATSQLAQTTLRSVLGKHELDEMLAERDKLNNDIQEILDRQTDAWGIKVANVEIKHIDLNETMIRAIARQAEAERERRSKIIIAEGEQQAAQKLLEAAEIIGQRKEAMQLRYLTSLNWKPSASKWAENRRADKPLIETSNLFGHLLPELSDFFTAKGPCFHPLPLSSLKNIRILWRGSCLQGLLSQPYLGEI